MRSVRLLSSLLVLSVALWPAPAAAVKKVPYPEVKVVALPAFTGDPALTEMRRKLAEAVAGRDLPAITALVAPDFAWTAGGDPVEEFDPRRDAVHNFKVAFGFRPFGKDSDGPTDIGPQWELLEFFATDDTLTQEPGSPRVCGSTTARVADPAALEEALNRVEEDEPSEWVYFLDEITLTATPRGGATVARLARSALPIVSVHPAPPPPRAGQAPPALPPPTHLELLLPSGKTGWAPIKGLRPLFVDRLCYAKIGDDWKISVYEQAD